MRSDARLPYWKVEELCGAGGKLVVELPIVVLGPGVEVPVGEGYLPFRVSDEDWAGVAGPDAVCGPAMEISLIEICAGAVEDAFHSRFGSSVLHEQMHALIAGEDADDLRVE